jgi:deoxyribonuclease V
MQPVLTHPWDLSPEEAQALQQQLRGRVRLEPPEGPLRVVGGVDVSVRGDVARAAAVRFSYPDLHPLEAATAEMPVTFPYVPGLLTFREGPAVLNAMARLEGQADVWLFDAHGLAHPRRMGLATHIGILLDCPAIGCAKSRLWGQHGEVPAEEGGWVALEDGEEVIGAVVRTRAGVRPIYVSVGHRMTLERAIEIALGCCTRYRLPEPVRWAHRVAGGQVFPGWQLSFL